MAILTLFTLTLLALAWPNTLAQDIDDDMADQLYNEVSQKYDCSIWARVQVLNTRDVSTLVWYGCAKRSDSFKSAMRYYKCNDMITRVPKYLIYSTSWRYKSLRAYYTQSYRFASKAKELCQGKEQKCKYAGATRGWSCDDYESDCGRMIYSCRSRWGWRLHPETCRCDKKRKLLACCADMDVQPQETVAPPTDPVPTTQAVPTTPELPTTPATTTPAPTTPEPTTPAPTTPEPTTPAPTTPAPITPEPTTPAPTTPEPTTPAPTTQAVSSPETLPAEDDINGTCGFVCVRGDLEETRCQGARRSPCTLDPSSPYVATSYTCCAT